MKFSRMWLVGVGFLLLKSVGSLAGVNEQVGTLTQLEGLVQIFTQPSKVLPEKPESGTRALFEGQYYIVRTAKVGDSVENGNIVRTGLGAKARVVFENGDQYQVGPGSAYRVSWESLGAKDAQKEKLRAQIDLMYGKFRGVVSKDGPRKKMLLRTPVAVMGVRGTDFYVEENPRTGETEFTVIRGEVEVTRAPSEKSSQDSKGESFAQEKKGTEKNAASAEPIQIKTGFTASVSTTSSPTQKNVLPRKTAQDELKEIIQTSEIQVSRAAGTVATKETPPQEVLSKIETLEKKALETTLKDIREHQPELHAKLVSGASGADPMRSVTGLNAAAVNALIPSAPKNAPAKRRKPLLKDLEEAGQDGAYDRYFKFVD